LIVGIVRSIIADIGVAACIVKNDKILLVEEARGSKSGYWGMPKGAVDKHEAPSIAVLRELNEECGITGIVEGLIAIRERMYENTLGIFIAYSVSTEDLDIKIDFDEISDYGWFDITEFDGINWISKAMREIAESSLLGNKLSITDYTNQRGNHYIVYS
tara:strand:+ start:60 stop:536 length:477 start_codon:yes stop_codon:yes gene_type:complete